jgi:type IV pilus assembly protein PilV
MAGSNRNKGRALRTRGVTLIEVLVTLLVLALGLVGMAALHVNVLKNAHSSYYRSIASIMALDYEERLWLAIADPGVAGCLTAGNGDAIVTQMISDWATRDIVIPNVGIGLTRRTDPQNTANPRWVEFDLQVTWAEDRFQAETSQGESFDYTVRVPCRVTSS